MMKYNIMKKTACGEKFTTCRFAWGNGQKALAAMIDEVDGTWHIICIYNSRTRKNYVRVQKMQVGDENCGKTNTDSLWAEFA